MWRVSVSERVVRGRGCEARGGCGRWEERWGERWEVRTASRCSPPATAEPALSLTGDHCRL